MKIKYICFQLLALALTLYTVKSQIGGLTISKSFSLAFMFWVLFGATAFLAPKLRTFFLLSNSLLFNVIAHSLLIGLVFWLCSMYIGGIVLVPIKFLTVEFSGILIKGTTLGSFGTITVVSVFIGTLYQVLIWLQGEK
jgi:hypothetical protein